MLHIRALKVSRLDLHVDEIEIRFLQCQLLASDYNRPSAASQPASVGVFSMEAKPAEAQPICIEKLGTMENNLKNFFPFFALNVLNP